MTAQIIDFASRRPVQEDEASKGEDVWCCTCGTISFVFHIDGRIECCGCSTIQNSGNNGRWVIQQNEPEAEVSASPGKEHDHLEF